MSKYMKDFNGEKVFSLEYDKETLRDMIIELQETLDKQNKGIEALIFMSNKKGEARDELQERINKTIKYCKESNLTLKSHYFMDVIKLLEGEEIEDMVSDKEC